MINSKHFLGYSQFGAEKAAQRVDHREQFDVGLLSHEKDVII